MNDSYLSIASEFVRSGIDKAGIPLTGSLEAYLSLTFAKYIGTPISVDMLTLRVTRAMDEGAPSQAMRALADDCLIACAFFEGRLRRIGSVRHYVALGQATYDAANMTEQAYGFVHMRDVIASAVAPTEPEDGRVLIDRASAGSQTAQEALADQNVIVGPWGNRKPSGLLWN